MRTWLTIVLIFLQFASYAQKGGYYFSYQIDSLIRADSTPSKYQTASWYHSFTGNYEEAFKTKDLQFPNAKPSGPSAEQQEIFSHYSAIDARAAILKEAAKTRILIINEAHHVPLHRVYLTGLLADLYKVGYRFLGMEALDHKDSLLNQRKYPLLTSGFYIMEPCFGNLVREALGLGFTVFPYEKKYEDGGQKTMDRELAQALNIKELIDRNPAAKFIIYCGYDHAAEDTLKNFMGLPMAGRVKRLTGIDPFTIDQTVLSEYFIVGSRYRKLINDSSDRLFTDSMGRYFNAAGYPKKMDCNLYHPDTKLTGGRPSWLKTRDMEFMHLQERISIAHPYLIKIFLKGEDVDKAVPIDVVEVKSANDKVASVVFRNREQVAQAVNSKGEVQTISIPVGK
jgi:hypothetical protein